MKKIEFAEEEKNVFTVKEKKLLVECLLFASGPDICAEWTPNCARDMVNLAKKLNDPMVKLDKIYLFEYDMFEDEQTVEEIIKHFPNLPRANIFTEK
jgi:hypothetical protein